MRTAPRINYEVYASQLEAKLTTAQQKIKELEAELKQEKVWKEEDPRMLREQIRVADVAFNHLHASSTAKDKQITTLTTQIEKMREMLERAHQYLKRDRAAETLVYHIEQALSQPSEPLRKEGE